MISYFAIVFIIEYVKTTVLDWSKLPVNSGIFRAGTTLKKIPLKISQIVLSLDTITSFSIPAILPFFALFDEKDFTVLQIFQ